MDKIRGGYLGLCLGDALGSMDTYHEELKYPIVVRSHYMPIRIGAIGQVSDDSTMATALLFRLLSDRDWISENVIKEYMEWANNYSPFLGKNTRRLFYGIKTVQGYQNRKYKIDFSLVQSNGSLMRAFPLILLFYLQPDLVFQRAIEDTNLTNQNPVNQDATVIYLLMLYSALIGEIGSQALPNILEKCQTEPIRNAIQEAINKKMRMVNEQKGWVAHAIYLAARAWLKVEERKTYSEIIKWINLREGDRDTNSAIAGALIGVVFGENQLKLDQEQNINILLNSNSQTGQLPYDLKYHPRTGLDMLRI